MQRTRREILNILKRQGSATLEELATALGVVPMTVRCHLRLLERDNLVQYEEVRGKVGRPRFVYSLTPSAEALFPKCYDTLLNRLIDCVEPLFGEGSTQKLAKQLGEAWAQENATRVEGKSVKERVEQVAALRTEEGAWAEIEPCSDEGADGVILRQHNCPCPCVAQRHPDVVCAAEWRYLSVLLGVEVERVAWRPAGDRTCAYFVPLHSSESERGLCGGIGEPGDSGPAKDQHAS